MAKSVKQNTLRGYALFFDYCMFLEVVNFAEKYASGWLSKSLLTQRSNKFRISSVNGSLYFFFVLQHSNTQHQTLIWRKIKRHKHLFQLSLWVSSCFCVQIWGFFKRQNIQKVTSFTWKLKLLGCLEIEPLEVIQAYFKY